MVSFAGYDMPVQFPLGIMQEHLHTREAAGLFDVSHMGQLLLSGTGLTEALERLLPVDLENLQINRQVYAVLTTEQGGILDDLILCRMAEEKYFVVVNAACKEKDIAHLREHLPDKDITVLEQQSLLALQGPMAAELLGGHCPPINQLIFMSGMPVTLAGFDCYVTRSGYTGEDGFEISVPAAKAEELARLLLTSVPVEPVGLGARDSLRLEAGLCLYGHDMDASTTPVEAGLLWSISKSRRGGGDKAGGFLGADIILAEVESGPRRSRVMFLVDGKAPVREGAEIIDGSAEVVGRITSGGFAPSLGAPIAMGYVPVEHAGVGSKLQALVRGKPRSITVAKAPLVPRRYCRASFRMI